MGRVGRDHASTTQTRKAAVSRVTDRIPHGTPSGRKYHKCRCPDCMRAGYDYDNQRRRQVAYGRWTPWGDTEQVRAHIALLRSHGWSYRAVADAARCTPRIVQEVARDPGRRVRADVARRILAVTPGPSGGYQPAIGTTRRVQALTAAGWRLIDISEASGVAVDTLWVLRAGRRGSVWARTAWAVQRSYDVLSMRVPTHPQVGRMRRLAEEHGWYPPLDWEAYPAHWLDLPEDDLQAEIRTWVAGMDPRELSVEHHARRRGWRSLVAAEASRAYTARRREQDRRWRARQRAQQEAV